MGFFSGFGFSDIIGGIGSLLGIGGQAMSNRAQAKENEKNRQFALDMWNAENAYNDPSAMIQRFTNAGLNPALIYGDGASTLSAHAQTPNTDNKYNNPFQRGLQDYFSSKQLELQKQTTDSTVDLNNANAEKAREEAQLAKEEAKRKNIENTYADANEIVDLLIKGNTQEAGKLANAFALQSNPLQISILNETLENAKKEGKIKEEEANRLKAQINLIEAETKTEGERFNTQVAETSKVKQEEKTSAAQADYYKAAKTQALAQANEANENAKRIRLLAPVERKKLSAEIRQSDELTNQIIEVTGLKRAEVKKIQQEMAEAIKNNRVERWKTTVRDHYGTGVAAQCFNIMFNWKNRNLVGISEDDFTPVSPSSTW